MRRLALIFTLLIGTAGVFAAGAVGEDEHTYFIELDNAFGLVDGSEVRVAGVTQGEISELLINQEKRAVAKVELSGELSQLGEDTICSSEPNSLIAEYFIDCNPKGAPLVEGSGSDEERAREPDIPVEQTRQTVQNDLVQSGLRQPYSERLGLIINEFGTALAGNPDNLNAAIRRGAPALTQVRQITKILGDQNEIIRDLNEDSDAIFVELADRREDVRQFVLNARDTASASAERREDLAANFNRLDDFLGELEPTMVELNRLAVTQTPLLANLRASAPGLTELSRDIQGFNSASTKSLKSLGSASKVGRRALDKGQNEIKQLRRSVKKAPAASDELAKFLRDLDDPDRAVEQDLRSEEDTGRVGGGYTGLEGLLNYVYYQTGALNQFDQVSHLLHFSIFEVGEGPCSSYNAGPTVPAQDGGETTDILEAHRCVAWLGDNQPGINGGPELPPYDPSVCPQGSDDLELCDPNGPSTSSASDETDKRSKQAADAREGIQGLENLPGIGDSGGDPGSGGSIREGLGDLPGSLGDVADGLGKSADGLRGAGGGLPKLKRAPSAEASSDLLGYLFGG